MGRKHRQQGNINYQKNHIIQMRHKPPGADANLKKTK
jgi:hypothetical protein